MFDPVQFWHWWALAAGLGILEVLAPGFVLIWLGLAAAATGLILLIWPAMPLGLQLLVFAALAVASVFGWFRWQRTAPQGSDQPNLNRRADQLLHRRAPLIEPIVNGRGRVKLGDSSWTVAGPDLPAGQMVEVIGAEGTVLQVKPVDSITEPSA
jgi:membrane protein implicated in regulation of membrane protease activity